MTASNLTVRRLRVRAVDLPMMRPTHTAVGPITSTPLALIDLETEQGVTGTTYVFCYAPAGLAAVVAALGEIGPTLVAAELDGLCESLRRRFRLLGTQGVVGLALNGIDMATWDARARRQACRSPCCSAAARARRSRRTAV